MDNRCDTRGETCLRATRVAYRYPRNRTALWLHYPNGQVLAQVDWVFVKCQ